MENQELKGSPYNKKESFTTRMFTNPIIRKLSKVQESAEGSQAAASYGGIGFKTMFFLLLTVGGVIAGLIFGKNTLSPDGAILDMNLAIFAVVCAALTLLTPILAWLIRPTIPVTGSLYAFSQGYLISLFTSTFGGDYTELIWTAMLITLSIVMVMYILYTKKIIKVTAKFKSAILTLFFTSIVASLIMFVLTFIPATSSFVMAIRGNLVITVIGSVIMIIIASIVC